jgi:hypothetical protein
MKNRFYNILAFLFFTNAQIFSQIYQYGIAINYGVEQPYADMSERFGIYSSVGVGFDLVMKNNIAFSLDWRTNFGSNVKQDIFRSIKQETGEVIGLNGLPAEYYYSIVGDNVMLSVRKIFGKNHSGIVVGLGLGLVANQFKITDIDNTVIPSVKPYSKIYDQLTRGLATRQFIGYEVHTKDRLINGSIILENNLNFTKFVRQSAGFSSNLQSDNTLALRGRWTIPFKTFDNDKKENIKYF